MFILEQDLETEIWNAIKTGTNHHTFSLSEPDWIFRFLKKLLNSNVYKLDHFIFKEFYKNS